MTIRDRTRRLPGFIRVAGLLLVLLGVALMHSVVFTGGHDHPMTVAMRGMADSAAGYSSADEPLRAADTHSAEHAGSVDAPSGNPIDVDPIGPGRVSGASNSGGMPVGDMTSGSAISAIAPDCSGCGVGHAMHPCVFVLTLLLVLGLVLMGWVDARDRSPATGVGPSWPLRQARPPPWTVPTLAELAILRI